MATFSLIAKPAVPLPAENGWLECGDRLRVDWKHKQPVPEELPIFVHCRCRKGCSNNRYSCVYSGLNCTDPCHCVVCENWRESHEGSAVLSDDEEGMAEDDEEM